MALFFGLEELRRTIRRLISLALLGVPDHMTLPLKDK